MEKTASTLPELWTRPSPSPSSPSASPSSESLNLAVSPFASSASVARVWAYLADVAQHDLVRVALAGALFAAGSSLLYTGWKMVVTFIKVLLPPFFFFSILYSISFF